MKYDDAYWHYSGDFPADLPPTAAATHAGMFLAWALLSGLGGELHVIDCPDNLLSLQQRRETPGQFLCRACDEKFIEEDLNDEGRAFAQAYFDFDSGRYMLDYENVLSRELPSLYHVPDTWETYASLKPILDQRLADWRTQQR
ncbi:DUF7832 domain-containing protein [Solimonas marina]|uniref:DUF7832 domain-containing protein n=1 Tax=Solimonas marina TaxID=2714601 RepID=A0A970BAW1_9GAMM|nr:hypothetical protein [Solimonas marina]NKF23781.1 hypothetical protein [Solimonas marina]